MVTSLPHLMPLDDHAGLWTSLGETALVTGNGREPVIHVRHEKVQ